MQVGYYSSTLKKGRRVIIEPRIPTLYVLIGIPGSGKSTFCKDLKLPVVSTDRIRFQMFGDEACQIAPEKVFNTAYGMIASCLSYRSDVVFDATSTTEWSRKTLLTKMKNCIGEFRKVAILFMTPVEECKRRNANRLRVVPEDVIDRQYVQLMRDAHTIPDQFDEVIVIE